MMSPDSVAADWLASDVLVTILAASFA
jgi:hypothetical protein